MVKERKPDPSVRITTQFRSGNAMVYDLSCEDARLTVQISPSNGEGGFTAAAQERRSAEHPMITEPGATRGDALRAVGRAWAGKNGVFGFPKIDWDLVGQALVAVRAIEAAPGLDSFASNRSISD